MIPFRAARGICHAARLGPNGRQHGVPLLEGGDTVVNGGN
jgi:hypothetical protein